jgi:hypothetical protein
VYLQRKSLGGEVVNKKGVNEEREPGTMAARRVAGPGRT